MSDLASIGVLNIELFVISAIIFAMTPGMDTVFALNKSISQGRSAGFYSSLGISSGILVHTFFASVGLSMLVAQSATAFMILKYAGACYLVYLGVQSIVNSKKHNADIISETTSSQSNTQTAREHYVAGLITNTLNPKVAMFFLAFFPQFISPAHIADPMPFVILGTLYAFIGMLWLVIMTYFSSLFASKFHNNPSFREWLDKVSGTVFILMGLKVAFSEDK